MANFAIKDAMDLKIKVLGESDPKLVIDYLNECSFSKTSDSVFAKKKGVNSVGFAGATSGTLTLNSELTSIEALGLALGGKVTGEKIEIALDDNSNYAEAQDKIFDLFRQLGITDGFERTSYMELLENL